MVRVRLFAAPREAVGATEIELALPAPATAQSLLDAACLAYPQLARWRPTLRVAVNREIALPESPVGERDEVALLPPVSGGAVDLGDDMSIDRAVSSLARDGAGAVVAFLGVARPDDGTERLEFEAYQEMALAEMRRLEEQARSKFVLVDLLVRHRLGAVPVGEPAVLVAVAARHRREAFEAASWLMDELKTSVPIWKKEVGAASRWIHPER